MHTWQVEEETNNDKQLYCTILAEAQKSYCIEALNIFYLPGETIDWYYRHVYLVEQNSDGHIEHA